MLSTVEQSRLTISGATDSKRKSMLGQYFTPASIARFMASLFPVQSFESNCRLLDAGAGIGSLSAAFTERWQLKTSKPRSLDIHAFEIDNFLLPYLERNLSLYAKSDQIRYSAFLEDFILLASDAVSGDLFGHNISSYTHAILNPPYKKIRTNSKHRLALRKAGIETVNLYSAFVALSIKLLKPKGIMVAIIPRSFCNGLYYKSFRNLILNESSIKHIHLFDSRKKAFKDDEVLQENIIIVLEKDSVQADIVLSSSTDASFIDLKKKSYSAEDIVIPGDKQKFIHIPAISGNGVPELYKEMKYTLDQIGLQVSTGPVVDFRLRQYLKDVPEENTVPLLYPGHFKEYFRWPNHKLKKPNAIIENDNTKKWLFPNGYYCVVRRFSSKEEKRRVVASMTKPDYFPNVAHLGFENHLNVFHWSKQGLPKSLVKGLVVYLNSSLFDTAFRQFNGHTQVNATDLRNMRYPSRENLISLGNRISEPSKLSQKEIDAYVENMNHGETAKDSH